MRLDSIIAMIGNTPAINVHADAADAQLWVKLEGQNPSGSIKDRACISNIRDAQESGRLKPGMTLLDASSGNMACAIAFYGKVLGHPVRVVCTSKLTKDKADFITYFGASLGVIGDYTIEGNIYCRELAQAEPERYCFLDQLHNWANPRGSYSSLGPELLADFPNLSAVVGSLGSGGSLMGTAQYLKEKRPSVKVFAVEAETGTKIPGTGNFCDGDYITPFIRKGYDEGIFDHTIKISMDRAQAGTAALARQGVFAGFQTGGVYSAALTATAEFGIRGDVVFLSGDSGWKNMEKLVG